MNAKQRRVARGDDFAVQVFATAEAFLGVIAAAVMPGAEAIMASRIGDRLEVLTLAAQSSHATGRASGSPIGSSANDAVGTGTDSRL